MNKFKVTEVCTEIWFERILQSEVEIDGKKICFRVNKAPIWSEIYILENNIFKRINECEDQIMAEQIKNILDNFEIFEFNEKGVTFEI